MLHEISSQKKSHRTQQGQGSFLPPTSPGRPERTLSSALPLWKFVESKTFKTTHCNGCLRALPEGSQLALITARPFKIHQFIELFC